MKKVFLLFTAAIVLVFLGGGATGMGVFESSATTTTQTVRGPPGPQGEKGAQGHAGQTGAQGPPGAVGLVGRQDVRALISRASGATKPRMSQATSCPPTARCT